MCCSALCKASQGRPGDPNHNDDQRDHGPQREESHDPVTGVLGQVGSGHPEKDDVGHSLHWPSAVWCDSEGSWCGIRVEPAAFCSLGWAASLELWMWVEATSGYLHCYFKDLISALRTNYTSLFKKKHPVFPWRHFFHVLMALWFLNHCKALIGMRWIWWDRLTKTH